MNRALNLRVPSHLEKNSLIFDVQHRAYGVLTEDPLDDFFGLDLGANVDVGIRYAVLPCLEVNASYTTFEKEYRLGASYAHHFMMQVSNAWETGPRRLILGAPPMTSTWASIFIGIYSFSKVALALTETPPSIF